MFNYTPIWIMLNSARMRREQEEIEKRKEEEISRKVNENNDKSTYER